MAEPKISQEYDTLKEDIAKLRTDVAGLLNAFKELGLDKASAMQGSLDAEFELRRKQLELALAEAKARGEQVANDLESEITKRPLTAVAAAFGIGFVLAKIFNLGGRD